jgi:hypothetical protein
MKSANLAQRLEEFEASLASLNLRAEPVTRRVVAQDFLQQPPRKLPRRSYRTGGIRISDQGLHAFRVR